MPAVEAVKVSGLRELSAALRGVSADLKKLDRATLRDIGRPVADDAQRLAESQIRNIGPRWGRMRIGLTSKLVYVAPATRASGGSKRPNLAGLLMTKAMEPALSQNERVIVARLDHAIEEIAGRHGL